MHDPVNFRTVVVQLARLGDLTQTWQLIRKLNSKHGCRSTALIVDSRLSSLAAFMTGDESVFAIDIPGMLGSFISDDWRARWNVSSRLGEFLSHLHADMVVNITYHPAAAALAEAIHADRHIGARWRDVKLGQPSDNQLRHLFAATAGLRRGTRNLADIWAEYAEDDSASGHRPLILPESLPETGKRLISASGLNDEEQPVALIIGSGLPARNIREADLLKIVNGIADLAPVVLIGSERERDVAERICTMHDFKGGCIVSLCGQTQDPAQLAAVLSCCRLAIGVDTGPLHVAAMVGTKCMGVYFGSMNYRETGPYGEENYVVVPDDPAYPCHERDMDLSPEKYMNQVPAQAVIETARSILTGSHDYEPVEGVSVYRSFITAGGLEWERIFKPSFQRSSLSSNGEDSAVTCPHVTAKHCNNNQFLCHMRTCDTTFPMFPDKLKGGNPDKFELCSGRS